MDDKQQQNANNKMKPGQGPVGQIISTVDNRRFTTNLPIMEEEYDLEPEQEMMMMMLNGASSHPSIRHWANEQMFTENDDYDNYNDDDDDENQAIVNDHTNHDVRDDLISPSHENDNNDDGQQQSHDDRTEIHRDYPVATANGEERSLENEELRTKKWVEKEAADTFSNREQEQVLLLANLDHPHYNYRSNQRQEQDKKDYYDDDRHGECQNLDSLNNNRIMDVLPNINYQKDMIRRQSITAAATINGDPYVASTTLDTAMMDHEGPAVRTTQQCKLVTNNENDNKLSKPGKPLSNYDQQQQLEQRLITTKEKEEQNQVQEANPLLIHNNNNDDDGTGVSQEDESSLYSNDITDDQRCGHGQEPDFKTNHNSNDNDDDAENMVKSSGGQGRRLSIVADGTTVNRNNNTKLQQHSNRSSKQTSSSLNPTRQVTFANGYRKGSISTVIGPKIAKKPTTLSVLKTTQDSPGSSHTSRTLSSDEDDIVAHQNRSIANTRNNQLADDTTDTKMAAAAASTTNFIPQGSLASLTQLDADTLANIEYIPTMKV